MKSQRVFAYSLGGYAGVLAGCWALQFIGSSYALVATLAAMGANMSYSVFYFVNEFRHDHVVSGRIQMDAAVRIRARRRYLTWYGVVVVNLGQLFLFALLFQYFYAQGGDRYFTFTREITTVDWLLYTVDCTFKSILDVPEIFDLQLRNIRHEGIVGGVIVAVVRLMIYSLLVAAVLKRWNRLRMVRETVVALDNAPKLAGSRLVRLGDEALPHLERVLQRPGAFRAEHEDEALTRNEHSRPLIELLLRSLTIGSESERLNAAILLGLLAPRDPSRQPYFWTLANAARGDPAIAVRIQAVKTLGRIRDERTLSPLRELVGDSEERIRAEAARALGRRRDGRAVDVLGPLLDDPASSVRVAAVRALGVIGEQDGATHLEHARSHADPAVGEEAVIALARMGRASVADRLIGMLRSGEALRRRRAVECVGILRPQGAADALEPLLADPEPAIRCLVTGVLGRLDAHRAERAFLNAPADPDAQVRRAQIEILAGLGRRGCVWFLERAVTDPDALVRECAIQALGELGGEHAVAVLLETATAADPDDRLHAIRALGEARAEAAYDRLLESAQSDASPYVRRQALRSLRRIDPDRAVADARAFLEDATVCGEATKVLVELGASPPRTAVARCRLTMSRRARPRSASCPSEG